MTSFFLYLARMTMYFFLVILALLLIWIALGLHFRLTKLRVCAELPNGLLVGRSSLYSFQNIRMKSDVVLKLPDGTVLIKNKFIQFYFSETSTYGVAEPRDYSRKPYAFAYRPDIGFVLQESAPEKYDLIIQEAGKLIKAYRTHANLGYSSLLKVHTELIAQSDYRRENCPVTVFPGAAHDGIVMEYGYR